MIYPLSLITTSLLFLAVPVVAAQASAVLVVAVPYLAQVLSLAAVLPQADLLCCLAPTLQHLQVLPNCHQAYQAVPLHRQQLPLKLQQVCSILFLIIYNYL